MATHDSAHVTFVKSYAQPRCSTDGSDTTTTNDTDDASTRKLTELCPSLMIAGDARALEAVCTVHSPKAAVASRSFSPLAAAARRFSFTDDASSDSDRDDELQSSASVSLGSKTVRLPIHLAWRQKLRTNRSGVIDVLGSIVAVLVTIYAYNVLLRSYEHQRASPLRAPHAESLGRTIDLSTPIAVLAYSAMASSIVYALDKPDLLLELVQTAALVGWSCMVVALYWPSLPLLEARSTTLALVMPFVAFTVCHRSHAHWKVLIGSVAALATGAIVVTTDVSLSSSNSVAVLVIATTAHRIVQAARRRGNVLYHDNATAVTTTGNDQQATKYKTN